MESAFDLEDRLIKLDRALHDILRSVKHNKVEDEEGEIKSLKELVQKIGSNRVDERETTIMIREMREKSYDS